MAFTRAVVGGTGVVAAFALRAHASLAGSACPGIPAPVSQHAQHDLYGVFFSTLSCREVRQT
jgi:hypothetical protein